MQAKYSRMAFLFLTGSAGARHENVCGRLQRLADGYRIGPAKERGDRLRKAYVYSWRNIDEGNERVCVILAIDRESADVVFKTLGSFEVRLLDDKEYAGILNFEVRESTDLITEAGKSDQPGRVRFHFDFTVAAAEELNQLCRATKLTNRSELLRHALRYVQWSIEQTNEGAVLLIEKDGKQQKILLPFIKTT